MGYLIPGGVLLLGVIILGWALWGTLPDFLGVSNFAKTIWPNHWYEFTAVIIVLIFLLYVLGHIVALISAMTIDSFLVRRVHGYPFHTMLDQLFPLSRTESYKRMLSMGAHAYVVLAMVLLAFPSTTIDKIYFLLGTAAWLTYVRLTFACYPRVAMSYMHAFALAIRFVLFTGIIVAFGLWGYLWLAESFQSYSWSTMLLSALSWTANHFSISSNTWIIGIIMAGLSSGLSCLIILLGRATKNDVGCTEAIRNQCSDLKKLFHDQRKLKGSCHGDQLSLGQYIVLLLPSVPCLLGCMLYYVLVRPIYALTGIYRPMSQDFIDNFCNACRKIFLGSKNACDYEKKDRKCVHKQDLYWITTCYLTEHTEKHSLNIKHWLTLYRSARNLSMAFMALYLIGTIMNRVFLGHDIHIVVRWWPVITGTLAVLLLQRYLYLYYKYYSKYIARAFVAEALRQPEVIDKQVRIVGQVVDLPLPYAGERAAGQ